LRESCLINQEAEARKAFGNHSDTYYYLYPSLENFFTSVGLKDELIKFGFKNVFTINLMFNTVTICIEVK